jgi:hypothetical protein
MSTDGKQYLPTYKIKKDLQGLITLLLLIPDTVDSGGINYQFLKWIHQRQQHYHA